ncbi:hypothetical protein QTP86_026097, partial [Hemibagrus guttatus]
MAPGCTMGRRQAGGGSVMLWAMFCWETLGPAIYVDVTLTRTTYLSIVADHVHSFMETAFPDGCGLFQQDNRPCHKVIMVQEWSDEHNNEFKKFVKFVDDITVAGLISGVDESAYRDKVEQLTGWCRENNLLLNTSKTKELVIDYRKKKTYITPLIISGDCVERVGDFRFLGVYIEKDLTWSVNTSELLKKAQERLHFLRVLRKNNITQRLLVSFYRCSIESLLTYCICVWYTSCTVAQRKAPQYSSLWKNCTAPA